MIHPQLSPTNKLKKAVHIIIHALHLILPSVIIVATAYHTVAERGYWPLFLLTETLLIAIFLYIIEAYYICSKAHRYPEFVYRLTFLNLLTTLLGRACFYQFMGMWYISAYPTERRNGEPYHIMWANEILGLIIWGTGIGMFLVEFLARAFHFTSWVWDAPRDNEGQLRLESDEEDEGQLRLGSDEEDEGLILVPDRSSPEP